MLPISFGRVYFPTETCRSLSNPHLCHKLAYMGLCGGMWDLSHRRKTSARTRSRTWPAGVLVEGELSQMDLIHQEECGLPVIVTDRADEQRGFERDEGKKKRFRCHVGAIGKKD